MNKYKITLLTILISGCSSAPIQTQMEEGFKGIKAVAVVNVNSEVTRASSVESSLSQSLAQERSQMLALSASLN